MSILTADKLQAEEVVQKEPKTTGVLFEAVVPVSRLIETARRYKTEGYFLESLTAVDFLECFEIVYHFNRWDSPARSVVKLVVPKESNRAPSITSIYKSANWFEREVFDMFGVVFEGHPNLKRILLPDSSTIHPLLKSFKGEPKGSDAEQSLKLIAEDKQGFELRYPKSVTEQVSGEKHDYYLNLGPQHPSTHGVLRVLLHLSGERILGAEPIIGYSHRNHEKQMEIQNYLACWPNMGRLDYVGAMSYNMGYALAIERAMGIAPTPRVEYIRVLFTELNRIASHLLWLGTFLMDLGAFTPLLYCFDDREQILDIIEMTAGERLTYDYFRFGGLDRDLHPDTAAAVKKFLPVFRRHLKDYDGLIGKNIIFRKRCEGMGVLTKDMALEYGVTGPSLRGSGVAYDLRRTEPYSIYPELDFKVVTETAGDVYARYQVRMGEMRESVKIVEQLIDKIPAGEITLGKLPKNVPKGEYYSAVEAARGSFGLYIVSDGTLNPYRIRPRTPSYSNLHAIEALAPGNFVADMVALLGSIDIVLPEIDR